MPHRFLLILAFLGAQTIVAGNAAGQEAFGSFATEPAGTWITSPGDRPNFVLSEDFLYRDPDAIRWLAPKGTRVDGASIPQVLWSVLGGPFDGDYLHASIIHDHFCDTRERTSDATHRAFYNGMRAKGVARWKAEAMYWGVSAFGPRWSVVERIVEATSCTESATGTVCSVTATRQPELVVVPGLDFGDPIVRALAEAKFEAIARTLKTTDGATLDIGPLGAVEATADSIRQSSQTFAELIETKAYLTRPDLLGIMATASGETFDELPVWPGDVVPQFDLSPSLGAMIGPTVFDAFQLAPGDIQNLQERLTLEPQTFDFPAAGP